MTRSIEKQLGIRKMSDSLAAICLSPEAPAEASNALDTLIQMIDSVYEIRYINQDTVGEFDRFEAVFSKRLKQGIADYAAFLDEKTIGQVWISFYEKDGEGYFYLMSGPVLPTDADRYALYQNRIQISVFDSLNYAKQVIRLKKMRKFPYNQFREIGGYAEGNYDGPLDVYKIRGKDSIEFIGRGFLSKNMDFLPYMPKKADTSK